MRLIVACLLAGCSFDHGVLPVGSGGSPDAPETPADAAVDARPVDAMIDACGDDDADGVCNASDDWPCGAKPSAPPATMTMTGNNGETSVTITLVTLDDDGRLAVASPQEDLQLTFAYAIEDTACAQDCIDQIEIGWVPGGRAGCPFDDEVDKDDGAQGVTTTTIRAPNTPQVYDLRANIGQNYSCNYNGANSWWGGTPAETRTIAKLCVH